MKKHIFLVFFFAVNIVFAQQNIFKQIKEKIQKEYPDIILDNKIISVNTWAVNDSKSREANIQFQKTATTFELAKLKGGSKGIIFVAISNGINEIENITLDKDKISKSIRLDGKGLDIDKLSNIVFDSEGNIIYSSLQPIEIFQSIQKLITR